MLLLPLTRREPVDKLYYALLRLQKDDTASPFKSLTRIGDACAPATIAACVYSGYKGAAELGAGPIDELEAISPRHRLSEL